MATSSAAATIELVLAEPWQRIPDKFRDIVKLSHRLVHVFHHAVEGAGKPDDFPHSPVVGPY